jgi:tetratricopeptide (TPR) repeat protein
MLLNLIFFIFFSAFSYSNLGDNSYDESDPKMQEIFELIDNKNFHSALEKLLLIYNDDKKNSNIQTLIGFTYRNLGDFDNSINYYKKAIFNDPVNINAHHYIALSYIKIGEKNLATEHLNELIRICNPIPCKEISDLKEKLN